MAEVAESMLKRGSEPEQPEGKRSREIVLEARWELARQGLPAALAAAEETGTLEVEIAEIGQHSGYSVPLRQFAGWCRFNFRMSNQGLRLEDGEYNVTSEPLRRLHDAIRERGWTPFIFFTDVGGGAAFNVGGYARLGAKREKE